MRLSFAWLAITSFASVSTAAPWTTERRHALRQETRELFYHGMDGYMGKAFPMDELMPISCVGKGPSWLNPEDYATNDVMGNYSLTLVDVLDTYVVLDDFKGFETAIRNVINFVQFNVNSKPQVFETTIRILGGLLSGHTFATDPGPFRLPWYRGELLDMAVDLGNRLLPAFATPTGIPYARVNLRSGVPPNETRETCTAGAGSLILEFGTLSRLTGDERFEKAAYKAFFALWNRRSDLNLVGNTINMFSGVWTYPEATGIGAGIDSFYEYALKWYVLSGEIEFLDVWHESYAAIMRYSRTTDGFYYRPANINTGETAYYTVDSLSAFWPGLQTLAGDIPNAIRAHLTYWQLWSRYSGLPEVWDSSYRVATSFQYPMRPEFIESTWYLYRATKDPFYLDVGERILQDITQRCKVKCGLAGINDLRTGALDDRMESFALSETLKYLYLLFDEENPIHKDDSNYVFTTEGHILKLKQEHQKPMSKLRKEMRGREVHQCPVVFGGDPFKTLLGGVRLRPDFDYSRSLISVAHQPTDEEKWDVWGWCSKPQVDVFSYNFVLSHDGTTTVEDVKPGVDKLELVAGGILVKNVTGVRAQIVTRLDGTGYDITRLGQFPVRAGQLVYVNDRELLLGPSDAKTGAKPKRGQDMHLRFFADVVVDELQFMESLQAFGGDEAKTDITLPGSTSTWGADPRGLSGFEQDGGLFLTRDYKTNLLGCDPFLMNVSPGSVLVVHRGGCTFLQKLIHARDANAAGLIVVSDEEAGISPSASVEELAEAGNVSQTAIWVISRSSGILVDALLDAAGLVDQKARIRVEMGKDSRQRLPELPQSLDISHVDLKSLDPSRVLYLNGHPLTNTRLLF